ncbi:transglutaminase domain-containing protein [Streptococcus suis]|uniref:transglutaminase domain-containing protein n=1 Tax=Streptococcus suis TaxID=1307 RepID=UPI0024AE29A9|nr:transglutaminase domain-containing protein [Streptococcus suis]MDW8597486.1 transglutaminase domain-containing protein [Streptococcus suis]MDW8607677.1 transglutaminase domain-containing protein [Streptococcus suis]MDW8617388.1 transglutaminase domain-containing protein [Streptococcus suis]HEL2588306.1 ribonuclease [Streptococcus suis]HEL9651034.1 ribonuclease [Streptococcus suis]
MIPIQQHGKRWLILTLTLSTSVLALASIGASQPVVFADENLHLQSQKNTNKIEVLNWETFSEKLKVHFQNQSQFHVLKLGFENRLGTLSTWDELKKFGENNDFLVINDKVTQNIHDFPHILVMNKGDVIAHNEEEYRNQMRELRFSGNGDLHNSMEPKRIHALFKIELDSNKRQLLNAAGLGTAENSLKNINGMTIYSHGLTVDNKYYEDYSKYTHNSVKNINVTKERFIANDDLIHKLIESSEAMKQSSERDKVKAFVQYVANHTTYDWEAANKAVQNYADINYYLGSDLFAVTERQKAMCVGFSTTAARAFNMLGLPAYVVVGKNAEGVPHATARVYYDKKWHTIDGTGFITGNKHQRSAKYSEKHFSTIGEDSYDVVEAGQEPKAERNYMIIDSNYESWAMKQKTADLLLFNKEKSLVGLDHIAYVEPTYITENKKNHLLDIYKALKRKVEETKATDKDDKDDKQEGYDRVLQFVNSDIDKLSALSKITEEEFKALENSMDLARVFLGQMNAKAGKEFSEGETYQSYLKNRQKNNTNSDDDRNRNELQENQANSDEVSQNSKDASAPSVNSAQQSEELEGTPSTQETISAAPSQQTPAAPKALQAKTELEDKTETSSLGNTEMVSPSSETAQNTVDSKEESDAKLPYVEPSSKESSEAQVNTVSSPQVISVSPTSSETISTDAVTASQEKAESRVSAPQVISASQTSPETNSAEVVTTSQEVAETPVSAPQVSSEIQTSPETNSAEAVTTSREMAEPSVSVPQVSSEIPTSSETAPAEVATEVSEESSSASQPSPETTPTETVTTSQEVAEAPVSAPQVSSEIPTSPETNSTEAVTTSQEMAESRVSAPQVSFVSPTLEVPKNERLDEKADATMPNGVGANTHEAGSVPTSDIYVQDAGSDTVPQPQSLSATLFEEAVSTVEPVGVATSSQERSAVAGKVKVPTSLERSNNSVEEEKVVDSNATIENREPEKKEVLTSENVLNSLVTIWVALSTSFFMRYFSRGK